MLCTPHSICGRPYQRGTGTHQQYCKHQGVDATLWSLHTSTHWPGQTRDVTDFVSTCGSVSKTSQRDYRKSYEVIRQQSAELKLINYKHPNADKVMYSIVFRV